jgi:glyoxylase-like metal-dependent hydrolase (beta-lactamase superfamily II)
MDGSSSRQPVIRLGPDVVLLPADNPGPMTLDGTNTYLLGRAGSAAIAVVDPGPLEPRSAMAQHREAILAGGPIAEVLLTHRHLDHSESASTVAAAVGCPVRAADPVWRVGPHGLDDGEHLAYGDTRVEVVAAPGHTADSVALLVRGADGVTRLLSGDTVLGRGTTVITRPDGDLGAYLATLRRLLELVGVHDVAQILPGHGPVLNDPTGVLNAYLEHRLERLEQVRAARGDGAGTAAEVVARVYADVDRSLWPAAEQSVQAQLDYLDEEPAAS